jgi:hypothetical protein
MAACGNQVPLPSTLLARKRMRENANTLHERVVTASNIRNFCAEVAVDANLFRYCGHNHFMRESIGLLLRPRVHSHGQQRLQRRKGRTNNHRSHLWHTQHSMPYLIVPQGNIIPRPQGNINPRTSRQCANVGPGVLCQELFEPREHHLVIIFTPNAVVEAHDSQCFQQIGLPGHLDYSRGAAITVLREGGSRIYQYKVFLVVRTGTSRIQPAH